MKEIRKTTISKRYVRSTWNAKNVPHLTMSGEYLKQAGFKIGVECTVKIEHGQITIIAL